jgi:hypothetical protein
MLLNHRQQKRAFALARQIYSAGKFVPCGCGDPGCFVKATRRSTANKIIKGQWQTLKLNDAIIKHALQMVSIIND